MTDPARQAFIFAFAGEFGYELFNWQGVVRKLRSLLGDNCRIVACSRAGMQRFYETSNAYLDISSLESYRSSIAAGYTILGVRTDAIKAEVIEYLGKAISWIRDVPVRCVFSFEPQTIEGLRFGDGGIYGNLDAQNNFFTRIEPDLSGRLPIERELGFCLDEPYLLCQTARREIVVRSTDRIPAEQLLTRLAQRIRVVLLNFDTGRTLDSYSAFERIPNCHLLKASTFARQSCLIHHSTACLFFSEGDFRSHIYVPPFMGKDVSVVAPASVYRIVGYGGVSTTPIDFWNRTVFRFGGQIRAYQSESVFCDDTHLDNFANGLVG
jgi:hypothetical protein